MLESHYDQMMTYTSLTLVINDNVEIGKMTFKAKTFLEDFKRFVSVDYIATVT